MQQFQRSKRKSQKQMLLRSILQILTPKKQLGENFRFLQIEKSRPRHLLRNIPS